MRRTRRTRPLRRRNSNIDDLDINLDEIKEDVQEKTNDELVEEVDTVVVDSFEYVPLTAEEGSFTETEDREDEERRGQRQESTKGQQRETTRDRSQQTSKPPPRSRATVSPKDCPPPSSGMEGKLKWQAQYYSLRVPRQSLSTFIDYWPYINLKERTLPLPNVEEYVNATLSPRANQAAEAFAAKVSQIPANPSTAMLDQAFKTFGKTIIILGRKNGMSQVIIPGKSTTSYSSKRSKTVKNYVWTPSVEFETVNYSSLRDKLSEYDPAFKRDTGMDDAQGSRVIIGKLPPGGGWPRRDADSRNYEFNPNLCPSLLVAQDYVQRVWQRKAGKVQKRMGYKILYYLVTERPTLTEDVNVSVELMWVEMPKESVGDQQYEGYYRAAVESLGGEPVSNPRRLPNRGRRRRRQVRLMPRDH